MEPSLLLQRYRRDRRELLEFILSSGLVRAPPGAPVDMSSAVLDTISVDYVLDRVVSGGVLDVSEATKKYFDEIDFPIMINSSPGSLYFLQSRPESSGSLPQRAAPQIGVSSDHSPCSTKQPDHFVSREIEIETGIEDPVPRKQMNDANVLFLGLPALSSGLSGDDMRETAYEVLLASVMLSRGQIHFFQERKHKKKPRFIPGLRSKRGELSSSQPEDCNSDLLDIIRIQMEISEALDGCTKKGLRHFFPEMMHEQTDFPQISLVLLTVVSKSDFLNNRSYAQWQKRQANILEELLHNSADLVDNGHTMLSILLSKLRNTEECVIDNEPEGRAEILTALKRYASRLSSMPGKFGIPSETYYWAASYHFNVKLYENLLYSVFDVLDDGQVVEEAEEIVAVLKLTWNILGITQKMHNALYSWVLFQQFVRTGETLLLRYTVLEMQKVLPSKDEEGNDNAYINSLTCSIEACGSKRTVNLLHAIFFNVYVCCSRQLKDYYMNFTQEKSVTFENVLTLAILCGTCFADDCGEIKYIKPIAKIDATSKLVHVFVEMSIQAAYKRILDFSVTESKTDGKHSLVLLVNDLKVIVEKDSIAYIPALCRRYPEAGILSFILIHQLYGEQLKPFLEGVLHLSESVRSVLAASDGLESCLAHKIHSLSGGNVMSPLISYFRPFQIRHVCAPLILHWVNAQHDNIFEWTKRSIHIEDWEPLSSKQRFAKSIIEIFRIIEETIDQFFKLNLPMGIIHLRSLLIGIVRSLETYLQHMFNQQVDKKILYPRPPALTRYKESLNPFLKKKVVECIAMEEKVTFQLNDLTASKLCVKLNTLQYIRDQLDMLEASIKQSWMFVWPVNCPIFGAPKEELSITSELVDESFTIFDDIRRSAIGATDIISDFIGTRVIFWDLRDSFLSSLYHGSVGSARLEVFVPQLDAVLNHICDLIIDLLRDRVVLSICQASMDGYVWVMLDGGPSRVFSETDVTMMREDLNILKDLFVANDQGLPSVVVEKEARLAQQIIDLFALKSDSIIEMLMSASEQIAYEPNLKKPGSRRARDADTLLRVLCHKKDEEASNFLKLQYQLPKSSEYEDAPAKEQTATESPLRFKRNSSFNWTEKGQRSFRVMMKKFQEAPH